MTLGRRRNRREELPEEPGMETDTCVPGRPDGREHLTARVRKGV